MATQENYFQITGVEFDGGPCQAAGSSDPSVELLDLPQGSLYQRTNGEIWKKYGPLANEWSKLESGGSLDYIDLVSGTTPANPGPSTTRLFASGEANRIFPAFKGPTGDGVLLQPMLGRHKVGLYNAPGNATTAPGVFGMSAPTALGTATAKNVATTNYLTRMKRIGFRSNAATGVFGGVYWTQAQYTTGSASNLGGFFWMMRFGVADPTFVNVARMFIGVTSRTTAPTNVEPTLLLNCVGLAQLSTNPSNLYVVSGGAIPNLPVMLDGADFPIHNTAYEFSIFSPQGVDATFYWRLKNLATKKVVDGMLSSATSSVPNNTTLLTTQAWRCTNTSASAVELNISTLYIETEE